MALKSGDYTWETFDKARFILGLMASGGEWGWEGGSVVKNPPANAGGHGFDPWGRRESDTTNTFTSLSTWA